jgi:NADPH:quinone reductase
LLDVSTRRHPLTRLSHADIVSTVNPHDALIRELAYFIGKENLPAVLSIDIVGEIVQLGQDVTTFKVGDKVIGQGDPVLPDTGGTQEHAILDADFISMLPTSISPDQASTVILNVLTSYLAVLSPTGLGIPSPLSASSKDFNYKDTSLVIIGGSSACGKFAIQLSKWAGVGTIVAIAGTSGAAELRSMGATHTIDRSLSEDDIETEIRHIVGDNLLYVLDCINRKSHTAGVRLLSNTKKGTFVPLAGGMPNTVDESNIGPKGQGFNFNRFVCRLSQYRDIAKPFYQKLPKLIDEGVLRPTSFEVIEGLDVDKINAQIDQWRDGKWPPRVNVHV